MKEVYTLRALPAVFPVLSRPVALGRFVLLFCCGLWGAPSLMGQTPVPMASQPGLSYTENFADIANWANGFTAGTGANRWLGNAVGGSGTIPNGTNITTQTNASFSTGTSGGVQRGSSQNPTTQTILLLSTGATDNTTASAIDFFMDFTGVNAGTLGYDAATVFNSTGNRLGTVKVYWSTDGTAFTEIPAAAYTATNNVAGSNSFTNIALPSAFNNSATARLRFYYHNGGTPAGTTGSRPKISIDNLTVTATAAACNISAVTFANAGSCNDNGTPGDPLDDFYPADVVVTFSNPPATGFLQIESGGDALSSGGALSVPVAGLTSPYTFVGVHFKADNAPTTVEVEFSAQPTTCVRTATNPTGVASCSNAICDISAVTFANAGPCNDNGTPSNPLDDFYPADVVVTFVNPPATGFLQIEPGGDALSSGGALSVPVAGLTSPYTFVGVHFKADNAPTTVEVEFSAQPTTCVRTATNPTGVASCSNAAACPTLSTSVTDATCGQNNGAINLILNGGVGPFTFAWSNNANTEDISGLAPGTYTVTVSSSTCTTAVSTSATVTAAADVTPPSITCPSNTSAFCANQVPTPDPTSVTATDNCAPPAPTVIHVGDATSNQTCANRLTISRTYRATDASGNTAECVQTITVNDDIPPIMAAVSIASCYTTAAAAEAAAIAATIAADNCGGTVTKTASTSGTCSAVVTVVATDACGNTATATFGTRIDNTPPTATAGTIASCYPTLAAAEAAAIAATTGTDNCPGTLTKTASSVGTCAASVTVTLSDACGNTASVSYNTRIDGAGPVFNQSPLPANLTLNCTDPLPIAPALTGTDACGGGATPSVIWINEFHYDNTGADAGEFVEVAGTAGVNLSDYQIILYNGNGGMVYDTDPLTGTIDNEGGSGFGAVSLSYPSNGIQNGAPDGIVLYRVSTNQVIQFLSYEGTLTATDGPANGMVSTDVGVLELGTEAVGLSLQLTGTGSTAANFTWVGPIAQSPGTLNVGQTITALPVSIPASFMQTEVAGSCPGNRTITRTWTLLDGCTNATVHTQTITLVDNVPPVFTPAPANVTVNCNEVPAVPNVVATDACDPSGIVNGPVWINELHYDNVGTDEGEFIEIAGRAGTNLAGHELFFYNGSTGMVGGTYDNVPLSGIIPNQSNGFGTIAFFIPGIQNGPSDGIAFMRGGTLIQFISYEGAMTAIGGPVSGQTSTDIGVVETGTEVEGLSLRLTGNGAVASAFTWNAPSAANPATPGQVNQGQTFPAQAPTGLPVTFTFTDVVGPGTCPFNRTITRTWRATDGCGNTATHTQVITVTDNRPPTVTCPANVTVNLSIFGTATVTAASLGGVTVTDNCSTGVTASSTPLDLTCADENQTRQFIVSATDQCGNIGRCTTQVFVAPQPRCTPVISIADPCVCKNNATTLENGQFSDRIKIESLSGLTWTITDVQGLYNTASQNPPATPISDLAGKTFTEQPAGSGDYFLTGIHVDAQGYTLTVRNNRNQVLTIGNRCEYPNPTITSNLDGPFCLNSPIVPLTGTPGDANIVSQGFTINGVAATQFNPAAGVGAYIIEYTVNGGLPKAAGVNDPGCVQKVARTVQVLATPSAFSCNDNVQLSLDEDCRVFVDPDMVLEGDLPCYDDYVVTITGPAAQNFGNILTGANIGQTLRATVRHLISGNTCWGTITVQDKLRPNLTCRDVWAVCAVADYTPNYLRTTLGLTDAVPTASDNCNLASVQYIDNPLVDLDCNAAPINGREVSAYFSRKWTATDASGNMSTCEQFIYLERRHLWDVRFPADVEVACDATSRTTGVPYIVFNNVQLPVYPSSASCEFNVGFTDQNIPVCDGTRKVLRRWVVYEWCLPTGSGTTPVSYNNPTYQIQTIKFVDKVGPVVQCPPAQVPVGVDPIKCCAAAELPAVLVSDNCSRLASINAIVTARNPFTGDVSGTYGVSGNFGDFAGNNWWVPDTMGYLGSTPCLPIGAHDVLYSIKDDCGNETVCRFTLNVRDLTPPIMACDEYTVLSIDGDDAADCYFPADSCTGAGVGWLKGLTPDDGSYDNCKNKLRFKLRRMQPYSDFVNTLNQSDGTPPCNDPFDPPTEFDRATGENTMDDGFGGGADSLKFYCDEVGDSVRILLRAYQLEADGSVSIAPDGNPIYGECMVWVKIQDKVRPTCLPPAHVSVSCENFDPTLWAYGKAKINDNCCLDQTKSYLGQCGLTHTANYNQFDTACNKGTIIRTFRVSDCYNNAVQCTQRIVVTYEEDYYVRFPDDRIVTVCDGRGQYGAPSFFGEDCELLAVSFDDDTFTVVPDACFKVERTWKVINWCTYDPNCDLTHVPNPTPNATVNNSANFPGPIVSNINGCDPATINNPWRSACVRINPTDAANTSYTRFWQLPTSCRPSGSKFNGYYYTQIIKIVDGVDPVAQCVKPDTCDLTDNDPNFWNLDYWWDATHASHNLCEMPIDLKITATDACSGANLNFRYLLFLDLDGNGTMETVVSSSNLPGVNTVFYGNANNPNYTGGEPRAFDHRAVPLIQSPALDWYRFAIQVTRSGANATAAVRFNTVRTPNTYVLPQLPHGRHKIKWIIEDGCGNETVCEYPFEIKDCKKPTVVCKPLSVNIMPTGMITLWASDFLEYMFDNCTPSDQLELGIVEEVVSQGIFPRDPVTRLPITNVTFTCDDMGAQIIQLWAEDKRGNSDYCAVAVLVQDNAGVCTQKASVAGSLKTDGAQGVAEGNVALEGSHPALPPLSLYDLSNDKGDYAFSNAIPMLSTYKVTPTRDDNPLNGVTTLDLALISKHILGVAPLTSPYRMIAADANKSGTITTFDVVELRKLILGIYDELPNAKSWRFVDKAYVFPNPSNPFQTVFPENKTVANIQNSQMADNFVGVKVGDVNGSATANNLMDADDRTNGALLFNVDDRAVAPGEIFEVTLTAAEKTAGYQFTLNHTGLEVLDIAPGAQMGLDNFAVFAGESALTTSFNGDAQGTFTVRFRAQKAGRLSNMLTVSNRITKAEAYGATAESTDRKSVALRFQSANGSTISGIGFELYQNQPNPFVQKTQIGFHLPEAAQATLTVFDEAGQLLHRQTSDFAKGYNHFNLDRNLVPVSGQLYYKVETSTDAATRKMIQVRK